MDRFSTTVDGDGVLTLDTGKITLGPAAGRPRPAGHHPAADADRLHLMTVTTTRPPSGPDDRHARAGRSPAPEERLPAPRPPAEPAPVERFTASAVDPRDVELTPERAAQIVRQSSNARWVGFLTVIVVILFIVDLLVLRARARRSGLTEPRLDAEIDAQQVTASSAATTSIEANCARCHGANGEGGIGPALNRQDKLFAHLNEDYLRNVLTVGGRYVCGNAELADAGLVEPGQPARAAELPPDRRARSRSCGRPTTQTYIVRDADARTTRRSTR